MTHRANLNYDRACNCFRSSPLAQLGARDRLNEPEILSRESTSAPGSNPANIANLLPAG